MFFNPLTISLLLAASAFGIPVGLETRQDCSAVQLVHLAGTSESGLGIVGTPLSRALGTSIPGTTTHSIPYDTSAEYIVTVAKGANMTRDYLTSQASSCPDQRFVLSGYSKGALVIHKTSLPSAIQEKVIAILVFGDPARNADRPWPIDSPSVNKDPSNESTDVENIASFCNKGDVFCDVGGSSMAAHVAYPNDGSIKAAAIFTEKRYKHLNAA